MTNLTPMNNSIRILIISTLLLLLISLFLPFIQAESYLEDSDHDINFYTIWGFQHVSGIFAFVVSFFIAGFGMGLTRIKPVNVLTTILGSVVYFGIFVVISLLSLNTWGNGYSHNFSIGFYTFLVGVISISTLSIINSSRNIVKVNDNSLLDS